MDHRLLYSVLLLLIASVCLLSCSTEENIQPESSNYDYAALSSDAEWIYEVDSVVYNDFSLPVSVDTFHYYVKHKVEGLEKLGNGSLSYKVLRFLRNDTISNWALDRAFTLRINANELVKTDHNLPLVSMVFPAKEGKEWNGNAFNTLPEQTFKYQNVEQPAHIGKRKYRNTVEVVQQQRKNLLEDQLVLLQYAAGVGMIRKHERFLKTSFEGQIKSGYLVEYTLLY